MSALVVVAALAAQAATPSGSASPTDKSPGPPVGQSTYVDLEAAAGYSSNPFLTLDNHTGRGFGRISLHGIHTRATERTATVLSAYAQNTTYTGRYGSEQSIDVNGRHDARVSEQLRLFGDVDLAYDKGGQLDTRIIGVPVLSFVPGQPPILVLPGSDFLTVTGREYRASGHVGGQLALSPRDSINLTTGIEHVTFKTGNFETRYTTIPVSFGYDRQVSPHATVGAEVTASRTDYNGPSHYEVISPELTSHVNLSERLTFSGAIGASFASIYNGISTTHSTGLTASASLCSITERTQFCGRGSVDQANATSAGPAKSVSVAVDYTRRLDADQTIDFSLAGDHYSTPSSFVPSPTFSHATYLRAVADYSRRFHERWFAGLNVSARKVTRQGPDPKADVAASLFIRYRFGDAK